MLLSFSEVDKNIVHIPPRNIVYVPCSMQHVIYSNKDKLVLSSYTFWRAVPGIGLLLVPRIASFQENAWVFEVIHLKTLEFDRRPFYVQPSFCLYSHCETRWIRSYSYHDITKHFCDPESQVH